MYMDDHPELSDFYNENDRFTPSNTNRNEFTDLLNSLEDWEYDALVRAVEEEDFVYFLDFENIGGLPSPLPLLITSVDDSEEFMMLPAEIWRRDYHKVTKLLIRDKAIQSVALDPRHETADADFSNNHFPRRFEKSRIELYKAEAETRWTRHARCWQQHRPCGIPWSYMLADDPMVRYGFKRRTLLRQVESRSTLADQTYLAGRVNTAFVMSTCRG